MCHLKLRSSWAAWISCSLIFVATGCRTTSHSQDGALMGAGLGTAAGAIIGSQSGHAGGGAVIGALAGAVAGSIAGDAQDARDERDAAIAHSRYQEEAAYRAAQQSVTNLDLITMSEARLSDSVIINAVQTRGGQFDLSPSAIIDLKHHGVSDVVILQIQHMNGRPSTPVSYAYPTTTVVAPPQTVYIAPPAPTVGVVIAPRPYYYGGYRYGGYHGRYHRW